MFSRLEYAMEKGLEADTSLIMSGVGRLSTTRCDNLSHRRKHYHASITFHPFATYRERSRVLRKKVRTKSEAEEYGERFMDRVKRLAQLEIDRMASQIVEAKA